jgi:hypothetical protein
MELNLSEHTLTSLYLIELILTEFAAVNNLVPMVTTEHKLSKPTAEQGSPHNFKPQ